MLRKLRKLVVLCLCLTLLPTWALALSWSDFIDKANQLQADATGNGIDQVVLDKDSLGLNDGEAIEAANTNDPDFKYLELLNALVSSLTFEGTLWLTDGVYALEGVAVNVLGNDEDGISITNSEGELVALYIDETSQIGTAANPMLGNGIETYMNSGALILENHADIYADYGILVLDYNWGGGDVSLDVYNSGTIEAGIGGMVFVVYGENATLQIVNDGDITAHNGIESIVEAKKDASIELVNNGTIKGEYNGAFFLTYGQNAEISLANDGQIAASDGFGALFIVNDHNNTTLSLSGSGSISGTELGFLEESLNAYKQNADGAWELESELTQPYDVFIEVLDSGFSAAEREALATQIVNESGILAYQNGYAMVMFIRGGGEDSESPMVDDGSEAMSNLYIFETEREEPIEPPTEPTEPPVEKKAWRHARFGGVSYSLEWLWQAWLVNGSRNLRVYIPERDEQNLLEQGTHLVFKELVSKGPDGNKMLTLTVNKKHMGSMLTCLDMETLRDLVRWNITTLQVVSGGEDGDTMDFYPLAELLAALESQGYGDCQEVWLNGMDGDAVIINANGEKVAL